MNKLLSIAILSSGRLDLLEATIHSLLATVKYPRYEMIVYNRNGTIGEGWNHLIGSVRGDYVLMCQDDWYFIGGETTKKNNYEWVDDAIKVLDNNKEVGIIRLRKDNDGQREEVVVEDRGEFSLVKCSAGGFSMNPFICRKDTLDKIGKVKLIGELKRGIAEGELRKRYYKMGYKTAKINVRSNGVCIHIGKGRRTTTPWPYKKT